MDIKIDEIVKQVLSEIDAPSRPVQPKTTFVLEETPALTGREVGKTAVLDSQEDYMIKNYVLPEVGPKEILVCVEGCMISPSDVTEFLKERRAAGSSAQGQEGTGIIVKVGSENLQDAKGKCPESRRQSHCGKESRIWWCFYIWRQKGKYSCTEWMVCKLHRIAGRTAGISGKRSGSGIQTADHEKYFYLYRSRTHVQNV